MSSQRPQQGLAVKPKLANQYQAWARQHRFHFSDSIRRHWRNRRTAIATWLVISVAVALPTLLGVVDTQLRAIVDGFQLRGSVTLFLDDRYQQDSPQALVDSLLATDNVIDAQYVSADQGLKALEAALNQPQLAAGLDQNPVPAAIIVSLDEQTERAGYMLLADQWSLDDRVIEVAIDADWLLTLKQWISLIRTFSMALGILLISGAVLTLVNVIRAMVASRSDELEVVALLGGTDTFNARPFLYAGLWYGFIGGVMAMLWVQLVLATIASPLNQLIAHYGVTTSLLGISAQTMGWLVMATSLGGVIAARMAVMPRLAALLPGPAPVRG